jgi:hypothetical protein
LASKVREPGLASSQKKPSARAVSSGVATVVTFTAASFLSVTVALLT